jgi:hypothetical protein
LGGVEGLAGELSVARELGNDEFVGGETLEEEGRKGELD